MWARRYVALLCWSFVCLYFYALPDHAAPQEERAPPRKPSGRKSAIVSPSVATQANAPTHTRVPEAVFVPELSTDTGSSNVNAEVRVSVAVSVLLCCNLLCHMVHGVSRLLMYARVCPVPPCTTAVRGLV